MVPPRQTTFSPHLENLYQAWAESNRAPQTNDYDMRGYFMDIMLGKAANTDTGLADLAKHYPDTYKLPNHPSFSNESIYSTGKDDPYWIENPAPYNPPAWKLQGTDIVEQPMQYAQGGRVNFDTGGLNYPNYNITTPPVNVTAKMPTDEEKAAYFANHDAEGNLIIPNEFAPPNIPHDTVKAAPPRAYNLPNEYSIPRLGAAGIEALTTLGSGALALIGGAGYGIGKNIAGGTWRTKEGVRVAEEAVGKFAQDYTYQPRTKAGQQALEGIGAAFEASKIPPIGIPELSMLPGMRRLTPTDVQVMHGRTKQYVGDPVADYYNAGQGITRDYPTLGAAVQRKAKTIADVATKASENLSAPTTLNKQTGAIFPAGAPKRMVSKPVDLEGRAHSDEDIWPRFRGAHGYGPAHLESQYIEILPDQLGLAQRDVQAAWEEFKKNKAYELYPDAPDRTSAVRAFQLATPTSEARRAIQNQWLDEFSMTNQLGMPTLAELKVNQDKAVKALEQTYPNMVAKYLGQENADPMVLMAAKDLPLTADKKVLIDKYSSLRKEQLDEIRAARTAAGLPPEGKMQEKLNGIKADIEGVDQQLAELTATKWDMERQWTDRDTQPAPEGYAELTRHETKLTNKKKILERQAREMETAPAIEAFHDLAVVKSMSPSEMKSSMEYPMTQFHPYLAVKKDPVTGAQMEEWAFKAPSKAEVDAYLENMDEGEIHDLYDEDKPQAWIDNVLRDPYNSAELRKDISDYIQEMGDYIPALVTPESAMIVQPRAGFLKSSGLEDVMKDYAMDIYLGKTNKSPEQYIMQKAQELKKVRDDKAAAEAKREELTKANYMSYINTVPAEKIFGNYAAIEFTPAMSAEELGKGLSIDTDVLNHCVGTGGRANNKHFGIWDPATGQKREGVRSPISNEMEDILNNGAHVTSIRDRATGNPVVTVKMVPDGRQFRLGFVSGVDNNAMDYKAAPALRDYLNSRSADISKGGSHLSENGVYDLKTDDGRYEAARANNVSRKEIEDFVRMNPDTPRFATKDDIKAMKPQPVAVATRPRPTSAESLESLLEARDEAQTEFDMGIDEGAPDHVMLELSQRVEDIDARINAHPDTIVRANQPVTDAEITHYIQNMDDIEIAQHLADWAMDEGMAAPDNWATDTFNDMTPEEYQNITSLRETVRAQLENNPEELQNLRELMGDWEPEAPMTLPEPTIDVLVDEYAALPASHTSQARAEAIRGQIINNVRAVNSMDPTISDEGAMELIGATTGIRPSELLANAVILNSAHLGMARWSLARRVQLQNFINQHVENQANNVQALPPALAAMADLVNELSSLTQLVRPNMDQYTRTDTLTDEIIANARPHVIPFTGAETPDEIANGIARLNPDIPPTLLSYLIGRRTTAEDVFGIRGLPDPLIHEVRAHLDTMHPANVPALPSAERITAESIMLAPDLDALQRMADALHDNRPEYTNEQVRTLERLMTTRATELAAEPDMQLTGLAPLPEAVQAHIAEMGTWTDEGLRRNIRNLEERHPQTVYRDLTDSQAARVLSTLNDEVDNRAGNGMDAGFAQGGEVNIRPSGSYHASKAGNADIKQYTKGLDIDLFNKYGVGITKQGVTVSLPDEKFKQSDISEMRARYRTDDNTEYGISKRPLENRVTLSRSNPKDQSEWRADFSPDYKGISYNKRFAQGGFVSMGMSYNPAHVSQIANELLGAMNG